MINKVEVSVSSGTGLDRILDWPPPLDEVFYRELSSIISNPSQGETGNRSLAPRKQKQLFENRFAQICGRRFAIGVNSGTSALDLSVEALDLPPGKIIVAADYGHPSSIRYAASRIGIRLIDISPDTLCMDPQRLTDILGSADVGAVIFTSLGGMRGSIEHIADICRAAGVTLIEDVSHAHGATFGGRPAGSFGDIACFSLHATKNISCGEGGMICCDDESLYRKIWRAHDIGRDVDDGPYQFRTLGGNFRLSEIAALEGRHRLRYLSEHLATRHAGAKAITKRLGENRCLKPLPLDDEDIPAWHIFPAWYRPELCGNMSRKRFIMSLCTQGVPCNGGWPRPLSEIEAVRELSGETDNPVARHACENIVWIDTRFFFIDQCVDKFVTALETIEQRAARRSR